MSAVIKVAHRSIIIILFFGLWGLISLYGNMGPQSPNLMKVFSSAYELIFEGNLLLSLLVSLGRILQGFFISLILALILGGLMASFRSVERNLDPIIQSIRHIAPVAIVPLAILWFGSGSPAAVFVIVFASFFPLILNVITGVKKINPVWIRAARTMGLNPWHLFSKVLIPAALPTILNGARISIGIAWMSVIAAELAVSAKSGSGSSGGIGQLMFTFFAYDIKSENLVVCMIGIGGVALLIDGVFRWVQRNWAAWAMRNS